MKQLYPTYTRVDFNRLIPLPKGQDTVYKGDTTKTVRLMCELVKKHYPGMKRLAWHLKANTDEQTFFNIFYFVKSNIKYAYDEKGKEQLRSPARTWQDRYKGVDCDCTSIFIACLLAALGYRPFFEVVKTYYSDKYSHIYVTVNGYILDTVIDQNNTLPIGSTFNKRPEGITNITKVDVLSDMEIVTLEGLDEPYLNGLEATAPVTDITKSLIDLQSSFVAAGLTGAESNAELRKLRFAILMNGSPNQAIILRLMPLIKDINEKGEIIPVDGLTAEDLGKYAVILEETQRGLGEVDELGRIKSRKPKPKPAHVKQKVTEIKKKIDKTFNQVKTKVKDKVKDVKQAIVKYNPVTIVGRNGLLLAIRLNVLGMASKLVYGYISREDAQKRGLNMQEWQKAVNAKNSVDKFFTSIGGSPSALRQAVMAGRAAKRKAFKAKGLGEPVSTSAAIVAAAPVIAAVIKLISTIKPKNIDSKNTAGVDQSEDTADTAIENAANDGNSETLQQTVTSALQAEVPVKPNTTSDGNVTTPKKEDEETGKNNTLYIVGGLVAIGGLYLIFNSKK